MKNTKQTQLNCIAHNVKKPQKPRPWSYKGATEYLNKNRAGIVKLRKRGFSWSQIAEIFENIKVPVNYSNLYQWQLRTFQQRSKPVKFKVGEKIKIRANKYTVQCVRNTNNIIIANTKGTIKRITNRTKKFTRI